ncbi:tetratricopeptide repeat protein [Petrachloros mirabilis]
MGIDRSKVLQNAQLFASKGQFDVAINEWKKLSAETPGDGSIHNSIGELHLKRNATTDAVNSFVQAANAFRAEGANLKAIATYKKVLKLDPSRYEIYRHLGDLNAERGLLSSAVQDYLTLGKHYLKERKTKEALDIYKCIVSRDPSNLDAQQRVADLCLQENMQDEATKVYLQLGRERSAQQRYAEAKEAYQSVLRIDPTNNEAQQFIDHFEKTGGNPTKVSKSIADAAEGSADPPDLLSEASRRLDEKQFAGAEAILNQLLTQEPGNPQVCQLLARLHLQQGQLQVALGEYRFLAGAALRAQDYPQAQALISEFLSVEPNSVPLLELQGDLCAEQGNSEAAVQHYGKAIEVLLQKPEPGMPTLHEEIFEKVQVLAPDSQPAKKLASLIQGKTQAIQPASAEQPAQCASAEILHEEFSLVGAEPDDIRAVSCSDMTTHEELSTEVVVEEAEKVSEATDSGVSLTGAEPDDQWSMVAPAPVSDEAEHSAISMRERFDQYIQAGQQVKAEQWLGSVISADPDDAESRDFLGRLLEAKGDGAGAALQYARALELLAGNPDRAEDLRLRELFEKVRELAPDSPIIAKLQSIMGMAAQVPDQSGGALPESTDGLEPEVHYTLGVAYKNMGMLQEALEEFSHAMKGPEVFLDSCLLTAVCLKGQEQYDAASAQLERLLTDPRCQGAKAQAVRYELGLLYEKQEQWKLAATMFEAIPDFHDVPERLASIRALPKPTSSAAKAFRFAT